MPPIDGKWYAIQATPVQIQQMEEALGCPLPVMYTSSGPAYLWPAHDKENADD